jgi:protein SCO1
MGIGIQARSAGAAWVAAILLLGASGSGSPATPAQIGAIRAQFTLQGLDGREVTQSAYSGRWLLVYFGYTFCPDVCPTVLINVGHVLESLGPPGERLQPIFITVDPARDTASHLGQYLMAFSSRIVGLRGDPQQLEAAARQFHVYYRTRNLGNGDYAIDHSSYLYVMAPDGRLVKVLPDSLPPAQLAAELRQLLQGAP